MYQIEAGFFSECTDISHEIGYVGIPWKYGRQQSNKTRSWRAYQYAEPPDKTFGWQHNMLAV